MENTSFEYQAKVYYQPSGKFTLAGPPTVWLFGGVAAVLGALVYSYALYYIPFVYLNFILTLFFAFVLAVTAGVGVYMGHIRNRFVALVAGLITGAFAQYAVWVVHFYIASENGALEADPVQLWASLQALAKKGSWTIFGFKPTGAWLYSVWGLEAMTLLGFTGLICMATASNAYCEDCGKWADDEEILGPLEPVQDKELLIQRLEKGDYSRLEELRPLEAGKQKRKYTNLKIDSCPSCKVFHVLTVEKVKQNGDDTEEEDIVSEVLLSNINYHRLLSAGSPELDDFAANTEPDVTHSPHEDHPS